MEVASELSLRDKGTKHSKMRREGHSRLRGQPGQRVGGGKVHSIYRERHLPAWLGSQGPKRAGGLDRQRHRDLLQRRECTECGISGTVATMWMTFKEEWVLLSPSNEMMEGWDTQRVCAAAWGQLSEAVLKPLHTRV